MIQFEQLCIDRLFFDEGEIQKRFIGERNLFVWENSLLFAYCTRMKPFLSE